MHKRSYYMTLKYQKKCARLYCANHFISLSTHHLEPPLKIFHLLNHHWSIQPGIAMATDMCRTHFHRWVGGWGGLEVGCMGGGVHGDWVVGGGGGGGGGGCLDAEFYFVIRTFALEHHFLVAQHNDQDVPVWTRWLLQWWTLARWTGCRCSTLLHILCHFNREGKMLHYIQPNCSINRTNNITSSKKKSKRLAQCIGFHFKMWSVFTSSQWGLCATWKPQT